MLPTIVIKVTKGLDLRIDEKQLFLFSPAPDLQETHWTADMEIELQRDWQGRVSYTHGKKIREGLCAFNKLAPRLQC